MMSQRPQALTLQPGERLPVQPRGGTMYWQASANTPPFRCPLLKPAQGTVVAETITELIRFEPETCISTDLSL